MTVVTPRDVFAPPLFSPLFIPTLPSLSLSDSERLLISWLQNRQLLNKQWMELKRAYYYGEQVVTSLGIAIPPQLSKLRTLVGWPAKAVDPYVNRLCADSFRLANATDSDMDLYDMWVANGLDADQSLAYLDALMMGRAYFTVGSPEDPGDAPVICVESPLNMTVSWDVRYAKPAAALQTYFADEQLHAALYLPDQTIHMGTDNKGQWQITDRDEHDFGFVPVVRLANRPTSNNRDGQSEIDTIVMSLTDQACRTLLNLSVASELYSVPQKILLGASEDDFVGADGTKKTPWQTYITRVLALERDDQGNLPEFHQATPYDPATYTKVLDKLAAEMAAHLNQPPQEMGLYTQGNPPSADSVSYQLDPRNKKAQRQQGSFQPRLVEVMQMGIRFQNKGELPEQFKRMSVDWAPVEPPQPTATTTSIIPQIQEGSIPATSDVTLKALGWSAIDRLRLAQDRDLDIEASVEAQLAHSIQVKDARADLTVATDVQNASKPPTTTPANGAAK